MLAPPRCPGLQPLPAPCAPQQSHPRLAHHRDCSSLDCSSVSTAHTWAPTVPNPSESPEKRVSALSSPSGSPSAQHPSQSSRPHVPPLFPGKRLPALGVLPLLSDPVVPFTSSEPHSTAPPPSSLPSPSWNASKCSVLPLPPRTPAPGPLLSSPPRPRFCRTGLLSLEPFLTSVPGQAPALWICPLSPADTALPPGSRDFRVSRRQCHTAPIHEALVGMRVKEDDVRRAPRAASRRRQELRNCPLPSHCCCQRVVMGVPVASACTHPPYPASVPRTLSCLSSYSP